MNSKLPHDALKDVKILVVDDEELLAWSIKSELEILGAEVKNAHSASQAFAKYVEIQPDLVICDLHLPDGNGFELIKTWKVESPQLPVILITAHGAIDSAISALRIGAFDFLQKPLNMDALIVAVRRAAEVAHLRQRLKEVEGSERRKDPVKIIGNSDSILEFKTKLQKIAQSRADTVLIYGETGVGKDLAAHALHEWSTHPEESFIEINCASIPETLLESELFGYEKGAFTDARNRKLGLFEIAAKGTIFLDEIGELPAKLQSKLLRALESRRFRRLGGVRDIAFSARVIAATNRDLKREVTRKNFRQDLFYRLNAISLYIPPLRERLNDIHLLVEFLLQRLAVELNDVQPALNPAALEKLKAHNWPGNIRELRNVLHRCMVLHRPAVIQPQHLEIEPLIYPSAEEARERERQGACSYSYTIPDGGISLEEFEKGLIIQALDKAHNNQSRAAQLLGLSRHTLRYRMEKFGLV